MNRSDFRNDIISYVNNAYDKFLDGRKILYEILIEFIKICTQEGIEYSLAYGSLLGIIRDDDIMPPWDRDIDVIVKYDDIKHLINVLKTRLNDSYFFESNYTNSAFPFIQIKIGKKGYNLLNYHIDIYYLIRIDSNKNNIKHIQKLIKRIYYINVYRKNKICLDQSHLFYLLKWVRKIFSWFYPLFILKFFLYFEMIQSKKGKDFIVFGETSDYFLNSDIFPTKTIHFKNIDIQIPCNFEKILKQCYGDYNYIFPIEKRFDEFYYGYKMNKK